MNSTPQIRPLSKELAKIASSELNEVAARVPEDIDTLRQWIVKQKYIKCPLGKFCRIEEHI